MAIKNIEVIEQSLGLEAGKLTELMTSEEAHEIPLDNVVIKKKEDFDALINNIKKESGNAAVEIAIKNARNELGLDFQGKTMENLLKAYGEKVEREAKVDPNKKYDSLKTDFEKLQNNLSEWQNKYNTLEQTYKQKEQRQVIDNTLLKEIPDNTAIPKEDVLAILKAKYNFNISDNGFEIADANGNVLKNQENMNLLTPKEFISSFITPYLKTVDGGAGGEDSKTTGKETSLELFDKKMASKGINIGSERYNEEMSKAIANGTLKL